MQKFIKINNMDNVAVALQVLPIDMEIKIDEDAIRLMNEIPVGHKFSLKNLEIDSDVIKYGYSIGKAITSIKKGEWVHSHNLKTGLSEVLDYTYQPVEDLKSNPAEDTELTVRTEPAVDTDSLKDYFYGYRREDGLVGIRNEIWIIPTVGCVNDVGRVLERRSREFLVEGIDEIVSYAHPYGCSQLGDDQENTQKILAGLINHPNTAGVLVLGLGCENNHIGEMKKYIGDHSSERVKFLVCQESEDELEEGLNYIKELIRYAGEFKREKIPASELIVGLKCGGSDGLSGISANPTVGAFSDLLIEKGGSTILTEVPEMFGAETILMNRCANEELFHQTVELINDFKQYYINYDQPIYENPSPGNKEGGITTLEDKSLGCTEKAGNSLVKGVFDYGERVNEKGLLLLSSPGNDLVASTALAASGAHIVLFTTGRGTPFGCPVPTVKISSNTALSKKKKGWVDFDAGRLLEGKTIDDLSKELYEMVIDIASGKKVKNEISGYRDLAIFKKGVTL